MKLISIKQIFILISLVLISAHVNAGNDLVNICDDATEYPPYSFYERVDGAVNKEKITGITIDILDEMTRLSGLQFKVSFLPWKRCLSEVARFGERGEFEVFINGTFRESRAEKYYLTAPVFFTKSGFWYSRKQFPKGLRISTYSELKKFTICGLLGYNYEIYGFPDNKGVYTKFKTKKAGLKAISGGKVDLFLGSGVSVFGFKALGEDIIPNDVVHGKIIESKAKPYYMFISKTSPRAYELLTKMNQAIIILQARGTIDNICSKYLDDK